MVRLHVLTGFDRPMLWIWRDRTRRDRSELAYDATYVGLDANGLHELEAPLDHRIHEHAHALLHTARWAQKERDEHAKTFPRGAEYRFSPDLWVAEGASRVVNENPFAAAVSRVRVHVITAKKYRGGKLYVWTPAGPSRSLEIARDDDTGPVFDVALEGREQHVFLFKLVGADGRFEPEYANRLWTSADGEEIWVHSQSTSISTRPPVRKPLVAHVLARGASGSARLHLWQEDSDFEQDVPGTPEDDGWIRFEHPVYTHREYRFELFDPAMTPAWEHDEAVRNVVLGDGGVAHTISGTGQLRRVGDSGVWTIEGDRQLFGSRPAMDRRVVLEVADRDPACGIDAPTRLDVWVNRSRTPLHVDLQPGADGRWSFVTYPEVVTSFRFGDATRVERLERHYLKIPAAAQDTRRFVVLGRADPLSSRPPPDLFTDPPFPIERPGPWVAGGEVRFALHCPAAALAEVVGEWTGWEQSPVPMRSTRDGAYWWARVPTSDITGDLRRDGIDGVLYKFRLDGVRLVQDPAADWVESSDPEKASRLVDHSAYAWRSTGWQRPGWEYLTVYQLHPTRFSRRNGSSGLDAITRELTSPEGYLREVKATAILLMPTCEFPGDSGWGYNPSFFYSVESAYGGPHGLERLVDTCHEHGLAVLLDVVFNHAGTSDNVLWNVARESFFDGDTEWGAMINFDHPQVVHFFERNLTHFMDQYRIDGFRFDFTRVIRFGGSWSTHVRAPGSGGGWEFMQKLRAAVHQRDGRCLLMAENLPNDWDLTDPGGPMDTQWCDAFHDVLLDASRGYDVMGRLADAMKLTHTSCREWYEATNYPESHDEVGNEAHRISFVARPQGLRRNKIAAAATLLSRGIPLWFMGAESGEWRQFSADGDAPLDLDAYETDDARHVRSWWNKLSQLRQGNPRLQGPAPLRVHFAQERMLAFSRGDADDLFVLLNFGDSHGQRSLAELNLPDGEYKELLNSTWGDYRVAAESEDEHPNGGWDARLGRAQSLNVPDYGVVVLERR